MKRSASLAAAALHLAYGSSAHAGPPNAKDEATVAQALFYEARGLMKDGKYLLACPKLEESLRLDHGIGTEFNLADCNEKIGKLATAWSGFLSVAAAAKTQNQSEREKVARDRAKLLEPRLPTLVIDVPSTAPPGLEVTRDGVIIAATAWGRAAPVDPGSHRIVASAPGKKPWEGAVSASEGKLVRIAVPSELPDAAPVAELPGIALPAPVAEPSAPRQARPSFPEPVLEEPGSRQRTIAWIVGGLGVAGLGVGAGFGLDSLRKRERSKEHCVANLCDAEGVSLRDKAIRSGDVATVATAVGAARSSAASSSCSPRLAVRTGRRLLQPRGSVPCLTSPPAEAASPSKVSCRDPIAARSLPRPRRRHRRLQHDPRQPAGHARPEEDRRRGHGAAVERRLARRRRGRAARLHAERARVPWPLRGGERSDLRVRSSILRALHGSARNGRV